MSFPISILLYTFTFLFFFLLYIPVLIRNEKLYSQGVCCILVCQSRGRGRKNGDQIFAVKSSLFHFYLLIYLTSSWILERSLFFYYYYYCTCAPICVEKCDSEDFEVSPSFIFVCKMCNLFCFKPFFKSFYFYFKLCNRRE